MTYNVTDKIQEMEWALECASRIIKKKHESSSRQLRKLQASDVLLTDLKRQLAEKDDFLSKLMGSICRITAVDSGNNRPHSITSRISVIIPVRNGGERLKDLLGKIRSQKKVLDVEIIIVDSESTDNSVQIGEEFGAKIIPILESEFNHGGTRTLGAQHSTGDYLVFTVQDAIPVSNYWLYTMICPFISHPELAALSAKQFIKPEADLFSLWSHERMAAFLGFQGDTMYSLSVGPGDADWRYFDSKTKRIMTFFDDVSSCIRRDVFQEFKFRPVINAEDIDFGTRLLENRKPMAYLSSTGVYHWHENGADDVFKRNYIGTKAQVYILENHMSNYFDLHGINLKRMAEHISGMYKLISVCIAEMGAVVPNPIAAINSFVKSLKKWLDSSPNDTELKWNRIKEKSGSAFYSLINELFVDIPLDLEQQYNFKQNCLTSMFMHHIEEFAAYLCQNQQSLEGREDELIDSIYKLFAIEAGTKLGLYYLEVEMLHRLTPLHQRIDHLLARGVCYSQEMDTEDSLVETEKTYIGQ